VIGMPFVGEGGVFVTDGQGLAIATRSCLLSRNPQLDEAAISEAFGRVGIRNVVWLEGDNTEPITNGHPDGYMAFLPDGKLLVEELDIGPGSRRRGRDLDRLRQRTADGTLRGVETFEVAPAIGLSERGSATLVATYMNLFVTGDALLTAGFGSQEDLRAERDLKRHFPGREVRMLDMSAILNGGGGIRCLTQPVPI